jgi:thymidylate synthase
LQRSPKKRPKLVLPSFHSLEEVMEIDPKQFVLEGYESWPSLKAKIAV